MKGRKKEQLPIGSLEPVLPTTKKGRKEGSERGREELIIIKPGYYK